MNAKYIPNEPRPVISFPITPYSLGFNLVHPSMSVVSVQLVASGFYLPLPTSVTGANL